MQASSFALQHATYTQQKQVSCKIPIRYTIAKQDGQDDPMKGVKGYEANYTPGKGNIFSTEAAPAYMEGSQTDKQLNPEGSGGNPLVAQFGAILVIGLLASTISNIVLSGADMKDVKTLIEYRDQFSVELKQ